MGLYPRLKREEFVFWIDIVFGTAGTMIWMILFGLYCAFKFLWQTEQVV